MTNSCCGPIFAAALLGLLSTAWHTICYSIPDTCPSRCKLVQEFPHQRFVLDHIAKPRIADGLMEPWDRDIRALAKYENVWCKLSGMVTEARWKQWRPEDFRPYLDVVFEAFGADRLMIGSDWPVCTLSATYAETIAIVNEYSSVRHWPGGGDFGQQLRCFLRSEIRRGHVIRGSNYLHPICVK